MVQNDESFLGRGPGRPFLQKGPPRKFFQKLAGFETIVWPGCCVFFHRMVEACHEQDWGDQA